MGLPSRQVEDAELRGRGRIYRFVRTGERKQERKDSHKWQQSPF